MSLPRIMSHSVTKIRWAKFQAKCYLPRLSAYIFFNESTRVIHSKIMDLVHFYDEFSQVESPVLLIISYSFQGTIRERVVNDTIFLSRHLFLDTYS